MHTNIYAYTYMYLVMCSSCPCTANFRIYCASPSNSALHQSYSSHELQRFPYEAAMAVIYFYFSGVWGNTLCDTKVQKVGQFFFLRRCATEHSSTRHCFPTHHLLNVSLQTSYKLGNLKKTFIFPVTCIYHIWKFRYVRQDVDTNDDMKR
jgi:hypothetical protein